MKTKVKTKKSKKPAPAPINRDGLQDRLSWLLAAQGDGADEVGHEDHETFVRDAEELADLMGYDPMTPYQMMSYCDIITEAWFDLAEME